MIDFTANVFIPNKPKKTREKVDGSHIKADGRTGAEATPPSPPRAASSPAPPPASGGLDRSFRNRSEQLWVWEAGDAFTHRYTRQPAQRKEATTRTGPPVPFQAVPSFPWPRGKCLQEAGTRYCSRAAQRALPARSGGRGGGQRPGDSAHSHPPPTLPARMATQQPVRGVVTPAFRQGSICVYLKRVPSGPCSERKGGRMTSLEVVAPLSPFLSVLQTDAGRRAGRMSGPAPASLRAGSWGRGRGNLWAQIFRRL